MCYPARARTLSYCHTLKFRKGNLVMLSSCSVRANSRATQSQSTVVTETNVNIATPHRHTYSSTGTLVYGEGTRLTPRFNS